MDISTRTICQIRAGKCLMEGDMVHPDLRKGYLALVKTDDDLLRVQWSVRDSDKPEESYYVFGDAYLDRINECSDGNVYALKFTENDQEILYWMQETSIGTIKAFVDMVNNTIGYTLEEPDPAMMEVGVMGLTWTL